METWEDSKEVLKSLSKSIKKLYLEICFSWNQRKKVVFFENLDFLYRKFNSKFDAFWWFLMNLVVFLQIPGNPSDSLWISISNWIFWWILINFFKNLKRISPRIHFSDLKRPGTRSLALSFKITCYTSTSAHIYEYPGYP